MDGEIDRKVHEKNNEYNKYMAYKIKCMKKALEANQPHTF